MVAVQLTIVGALRLEGALHIGSGGGGQVGVHDTLTDAALVRDSGGRPYIPGSSLRGVLRAAVGRLAPVLVPPAGVLREEEDFADRLRSRIAGKREADIQHLLEDPSDRDALRPIERLFGTTLWASPLHIPDLPLRTGYRGVGEVRHGVGIDRDTGAARENIKYDFEVLPKGAVFDLMIRCELPDRHRVVMEQLLAIGVQLLCQGELTLGGRSARGVGQVRLDTQEMAVYRLDQGDKAALLNALTAPADSPERYGTLESGWLDATLKEL